MKKSFWFQTSTVYLASIATRSRRRPTSAYLPLTEINNRHRVLLLHGGIGKVHGGLFILLKVAMEMHQVLQARCDLLKCSNWKDFWTRLVWIQRTLLQMDRLQLTAVHCNRRVVLRQHLKRPVFAVWTITRKYKKFTYRWKVNTWEHWRRLN